MSLLNGDAERSSSGATRVNTSLDLFEKSMRSGTKDAKKIETWMERTWKQGKTLKKAARPMGKHSTQKTPWFQAIVRMEERTLGCIF